MEHKILLCLLVILPNIKCQTKDEVLQSIEELMKEVEQFQYPENHNEFDHSPFVDAGEYGTYDFIIVGAGSAGTLLANRLSEIPEWKILLLEAGGDDSPATDIPGIAGALQFSRFNWGYRSIPHKNCCLGQKNRQCVIPRGKVLGGSSSINFMVYTRGNKADYDQWAADGNPGWSYDEILPYFIKMEKSSLTENVDEAYHGKNGTLSVEHVRVFGEFAQAFLDGEVELGRKILDYNGKEQIGVSRVQSNLLNGRRCSGNKAFLRPASKRRNLTIIKKAFVTKILFDNTCKTCKKALGVEFLVGNKRNQAKTIKEVILSAGAVGSPQILMHSGIGPQKDLEELGIDVISDLPVGENLHDHPLLPFLFATNFTEPTKPMNEMVSEYLDGHGFLTTAGAIQSIGFINIEDKSSSNPDLELIASSFFDISANGLPKLFNYDDAIYENFIKPYGETSAVYFQYLAHQKSRGSIKLKSKNIFDHPNIDFNYYDDPYDIRIMIDGLKDFLKLLNTTAMKKIDAKVLHNPIPQCSQEFMSNDYMDCMIRHVIMSMYHLAGTCKMGPESDPGAVVNHKLKVKGFKNLRVVDASVIPFPLAAHTNAPVYMVAEKASDIIRKKYLV